MKQSTTSQSAEVERLRVLEEYAIFDTPPEDVFDELTALASHLCESPISLITLVGKDRTWCKSACGMPRGEGARALSFCTWAIRQPDLFVVPDMTLDDRFRENPFVQGPPCVRFYAGAPLISPEGFVLGTLCIIDSQPRQLCEKQKKALRVLSQHVMTLMDLRRRDKELLATRARLQEERENRMRQEAEREERNLSEQMVNSLPGIFYLFDKSGQLLRWNENLETVSGYSAQELRNLRLTDLFQSRDSLLIARRTQEAFDTGKTEVEADLVDREGRSTPYYFTGVRILYRDQPCIIGMGIDISALRCAQAERDQLFSISRDLLCVASFDGCFKEVNPAASNILGYSKDEILGRPVLDFVHPDDRESTHLQIEKVIRNEDSLIFENRYICKDATTKWLAWTAVAVPEQKLIYGIGRDITESKRIQDALRESQSRLRISEERYRSLVEGARDGIFAVSGTGLITALNTAFEKFTGWNREEAVGRPFSLLVHPDDQKKVAEAIHIALTGNAPSSFELRLQAGDGSFAPMELTVTEQRVEEKVVGVLGIARDIRERRSLEDQLRQVQKLESVGQLAAGIAHDYNNILTVQQGHASLLLAAWKLPPEAEDSVRQILAASDRAAALTRQLLLFSSRQPIQTRPLDLNTAITTLTKMLERILGEDIQVSLRCQRNLPWVIADPSMIDQVIMNLAVNARDAMPKGGNLEIATQKVTFNSPFPTDGPGPRKGPYVCLQVTDSGSGIHPKDKDRIFEPFFSTKDVGKGTGLGLATVHGIVRQHNGWIEVDSRPGSGTTFTVFLPATSEKHVSEKTLHPASLKEETTATILIVEDEGALRAMIRSLLERFGYAVLDAENGPAALKLWKSRQTKIDLLITDIVMPKGISGLQLANRLRKENPRLRVILTSGYSAELASRQPNLEPGFRFLPKPYSPDKLATEVRGILES